MKRKSIDKKGISVPRPEVGPPVEFDKLDRFPPVMIPAAKENIASNLKKYRDMVLDWGAEDAQIVRAKDIPQDVRAGYMCLFPACRWLNSNRMCPQRLQVPWQHAKDIMDRFEYAIVYKVLPPTSTRTPDVGEINLRGFYGKHEPPDLDMLARNIYRMRMLNEMARKLQQITYYDGYVFNMSMAVGPCMVTLCADTGRCEGLKEGSFCKYLEVFPRGASLYIDYHTLGRALGWGELQPGGNCIFPEDVPDHLNYYNIGLTLVI